MRKLGTSIAACAIASLIAAAGCNSSTTPSPSPSPSSSPANVSGDYVGSVQDAQGGSGTATATLAQNGSNAGGAITIAQTGATLTAQVSLAIASGTSLSGAMVVDYPNGTTCTFSTSGTYSNNGTSAVITGSYTAITNCAGDTGTYTLNQQCIDTVTSTLRRIMTYPPRC